MGFCFAPEPHGNFQGPPARRYKLVCEAWQSDSLTPFMVHVVFGRRHLRPRSKTGGSTPSATRTCWKHEAAKKGEKTLRAQNSVYSLERVATGATSIAPWMPFVIVHISTKSIFRQRRLCFDGVLYRTRPAAEAFRQNMFLGQGTHRGSAKPAHTQRTQDLIVWR